MSSRFLETSLPLNPPNVSIAQIQEPPKNLLTLPTELQKDIIDLLSVPSLLSLRITHPHFTHLIPSPTHAQLLALEQDPWAQSLSLYTCKDCLCLRPKSKFADGMTKGKRGLNGSQPQSRFCIDWAWRIGCYEAGTIYAGDADMGWWRDEGLV